jgi:RNA polymerase sigma-70 factor (ECF subfamily)
VESQTDSFVMQLVQTGDTARLAVLFERYHAGLFRYLLHMTGDRALSEDLVQDVFLRILKYARSYDPDQSFPVWLFSMARHALIDQRRKPRMQGEGDEIGEIRSKEPVPEELFMRKQDIAHLEKALGQLPADKREVLVLSRFHELRHEEIGRILDCETGTVKVRIYRALKELRAAFCAMRGEKAL